MCCDEGPCSVACLGETVGQQLLIGCDDGVAADAELIRQHTRRWQPQAGRQQAVDDRSPQRAVHLLRLTTDTFMGTVRETLDREPAKLADFVATPTSYRNRPPGAPTSWPPR